MEITTSTFGFLPDGSDVKLVSIKNRNGIVLSVSGYGATITSILTPDKKGNFTNIVCGFNSLDGYLNEKYVTNYPYFGVICGRVANRIAKGRFTLEGTDYQLAVNNGPNHLHGGLIGFDRKNWKIKTIKEENRAGIVLSYLSSDGEENYPGNLEVICYYWLTDKNELVIEYEAKTDKTTIVNLTNHSYFNLTGGNENIFGHELKLNAGSYTESIDMIPTGKILSVKGTPFDFTKFKEIGQDISQLETGYDLNLVLDNQAGELKQAGSLRENTSGRQVDVFTTQPGIQLYTGYWIPELEVEGKKCFGSYSGVALETQHYPDSVNHPAFPTVILKPGETYRQKTVYKFSLLTDN